MPEVLLQVKGWLCTARCKSNLWMHCTASLLGLCYAHCTLHCTLFFLQHVTHSTQHTAPHALHSALHAASHTRHSITQRTPLQYNLKRFTVWTLHCILHCTLYCTLCCAARSIARHLAQSPKRKACPYSHAHNPLKSNPILNELIDRTCHGACIYVSCGAGDCLGAGRVWLFGSCQLWAPSNVTHTSECMDDVKIGEAMRECVDNS
jgi:hypothetical protein